MYDGLVNDGPLGSRNVLEKLRSLDRKHMAETASVPSEKQNGSDPPEGTTVLAANLLQEMAWLGVGAPQLVRLMNEKGKDEPTDKDFQQVSIDRYIGNERERTDNRYRRAFARVFGYVDPNSILRPDHIARREAERGRSQAVEPKTKPSALHRATAPGFTELLKSFDGSLTSDPDENQRTIDDVLDSPLAPYLLIAAHWLSSRLQHQRDG